MFDEFTSAHDMINGKTINEISQGIEKMKGLVNKVIDVNTVYYDLAYGYYRISDFYSFIEFASRVDGDFRIQEMKKKIKEKIKENDRFEHVNKIGRIIAFCVVSGAALVCGNVSLR